MNLTRRQRLIEMTGPSFSPDGLLLFANVQEPGHTFVIRGPWRSYLG